MLKKKTKKKNVYGTFRPLRRDVDRFMELTVHKHGGLVYEWFAKVLDVFEKSEKDNK